MYHHLYKHREQQVREENFESLNDKENISLKKIRIVFII